MYGMLDARRKSATSACTACSPKLSCALFFPADPAPPPRDFACSSCTSDALTCSDKWLQDERQDTAKHPTSCAKMLRDERQEKEDKRLSVPNGCSMGGKKTVMNGVVGYTGGVV